jgi:hypothetical protein
LGNNVVNVDGLEDIHASENVGKDRNNNNNIKSARI